MKKAITLLALLYIAAFAQQKGTFTDTRDGKTYKTTKIGSQVWMAENLNFNAAGSRCYGDGSPEYSASEVQANCDKYGRLYNWATAMKVCPKGWHLPSNEEWETLFDFAGGYKIAGKIFKAVGGWDDYKGKSGNGTDIYGFSALPGGTSSASGGGFGNVGYHGFWWSTSEYGNSNACVRYISYDEDGAYDYDFGKSRLFSVRCVRD
jgi:uncharacterized protein (TIGR02145 family)